MRIITGALGGRTLRMPRDGAFRPTTDRVKESVFSILGGWVNWDATSACDLFAGSGNLGIEALSRGASSCCFVEQSRDSLSVLDRNIAELGLAPKARIVRRSVEQFLKQHAEQFSLILADPPYRYPRAEIVLDGIAARLAAGGIAVLEHEGERASTDTGALRVIDRREYGTTAVTFFQLSNGEQP